jgi:hypothetical protein
MSSCLPLSCEVATHVVGFVWSDPLLEVAGCLEIRLVWCFDFADSWQGQPRERIESRDKDEQDHSESKDFDGRFDYCVVRELDVVRQ